MQSSGYHDSDFYEVAASFLKFTIVGREEEPFLEVCAEIEHPGMSKSYAGKPNGRAPSFTEWPCSKKALSQVHHEWIRGGVKGCSSLSEPSRITNKGCGQRRIRPRLHPSAPFVTGPRTSIDRSWRR